MQSERAHERIEDRARWVDVNTNDVWERRRGSLVWKYLGRADSSHFLDVFSLTSHNSSHDKDVFSDETTQEIEIRIE